MEKTLFDKYVKEMKTMREIALKRNPNLALEEKVAMVNTSATADTPDMSGNGRLIVNVTTVRGLYPVKNALVTVFKGGADNMEVVDRLNTDESGKTPIFNLPAPPAVLTESPENTVRPYAFYNILTEADGFIDNINYNATIFDGVTSLQNVNMVPRSKENDQPIVNDEYEEHTL